MKKLVLVAAVIMLGFSIFAACSGAPKEQTPAEKEAAIAETIEGFTDAMRKQDYDAALQYFAITDYVDGYDAELSLKRLGIEVDPPTLEGRVQEASTQSGLFMSGFLIDLEQGQIAANDETIAALIEKIPDLKLLRIDEPMPSANNTESARANYVRRAAVNGADDFVYRTAFYELDGKTYACGFGLMQYGDKWLLYETQCSLLNIPAAMSSFPVSEEEYEEMIADRQEN